MRNNKENIDTKNFPDIDQKVREAQIQLLFKQTKTGLIGVLFVAFFACIAFWQIIPQWKLSLWLGFIILITLARGYTIYRFQKRTALASNTDRWARHHVIGIIFSGLIWVIPFVFLWPTGHTNFQLVWPMIILPLSAAAVATYHTWKPSYLTFLILTAVPISLRFFYEGGELFNLMGILTIIFIWILMRAGKVMHTASVRSSEFGIRNEDLNKDLTKGIIITEELNKQLKQEVLERKLAEREIRKLSKVFLEGTNPSFIEDLNGNILEMNDEAVNIYGFSREELIGKSINNILPEQKHDQMNKMIKLCTQGEIVKNIESIRRKKGGKQIPVLMTLSLLTEDENKPFGIASTASDLTEQKNIEKELIKSKAIAETANATKDKFFKIISHDLRTPFNSIIGFSNFLNKEYDSLNDLKRKDCIQKLNKSSLHAYDLLENLLTWARTQNNEITIIKETTNLKELVNCSISTYLLNAASKNISLNNNVKDDLIISIDKNTALTFIRNIVNNAIKFTQFGGQINIDSQISTNTIRIHITDTGVGMTAEVIDNLFRIDKNISTKGTNNENGTGLGLILCKEFIKKNGGSISVKSEINKGSEFIISLPLVKE